MNILQFGLKSFFRPRTYGIDRQGAPVGEIAFAKRWEGATITIGGTSYTAAREGKMSGALYMEKNGNRLADADKPSARKPLFTVRVGGRTLTLKKASFFARTFALTEGDRQIGSIAPIGWVGRKCKAELPDDLALEIQAFVIWLAIIMQRRATAQAALIGGISGGFIAQS